MHQVAAVLCLGVCVDGLARAIFHSQSVFLSWVLKLPDCFVPGDAAPDFPQSRAHMRAGDVFSCRDAARIFFAANIW